MKQYFSGLRARLLMLVLLAVIPAFALSAYTAVRERQQAAINAERDVRNLVQLAAREQRRLIASTRQLLVSLSKLSEVKQPADAATCHRTLVDVLKPFPYYRNLGVALPTGDVFCRSHPNTARVNISDRSYFIRAMESRDFGIGDYQIGRATGLNSINFGQAILDARGNMRAVVYAALDLTWLNQLIATNELPPNSTLTVIDSSGTILARYPQSEFWVGKAHPKSALIQTILKNKKDGIAELKGLDGVNRIYAFAPLHDSPSGNVYVTVGLSTEIAFAAANADFNRSIVSLFAVMIFAIILAWTIGETFVLRRIKALANAARRLGEGDLTARTGLPHGKTEEIGQLAGAFDRMASGLQLMTTALRRVNRALKTLSECNRIVTRVQDERALLSDICSTIVKAGGYRCAWIGYVEHDENKTIHPVAESGFECETDSSSNKTIESTWGDKKNEQGLAAAAIRTVKPHVIHNFLNDPALAAWHDEARRWGYASGAAFPISINGKAIGVLVIYSEEPDAFSMEELELLIENVQDLSFGIVALRARDEHNRALEHMAYFDSLTGLPNRAQLEQSLRRAVSDANQRNEPLALAIVDINRLWEINDALGFHHGDQLLKEVGGRIRSIFNTEILVARMRGDEFAVLLPKTDADEAVDVIQQILDALRQPVSLNNVTFEMGAVVGVSLYPNHGRQAVELIRHADVAMHQAKKSGKGYSFYVAAEDEDHAKRLSLVSELRHAIDNDELVLHYQPKIDMPSGGLCGMEALVRWNHPVRGLVPPDEFIALAEQSGLINSLTDWVLRTALQQSARWRKTGVAVPVAVNLSARTLRDSEFLERIRALLYETGAAPSWLELELTEGAIMEDPERALETLTQLNAMGITLFIDDFGTGYSSLGYLKKLPVDAVKIDKSFVMDMLTDTDSAAIVRSTISLAHDLDLKVVAEGVESQGIMEKLAGLGCDVAQGYHISRPLPPDQWNKLDAMSKMPDSTPSIAVDLRKVRK